MDRFGVTAGRTGVDLTVGILTGPRRRVEIQRLGQGHGAHRRCLPRETRRFWAILSFRQDPSDEPIEGLEPDEVSLGVHQRTAEGRQEGPCLRLQTDEPSGGSRPNADPTIRRSIEDAVSPNPFARIRNERYECAQSISAFLLSRYICDADPPTEAQEEGPPEGLRGRSDRTGLLR